MNKVRKQSSSEYVFIDKKIPCDVFLPVIRKRMNELGLSESAIAKRMGVTRQFINGYFKEKVKSAHVNTIIKFCNACDLPPQEILGKIKVNSLVILNAPRELTSFLVLLSKEDGGIDKLTYMINENVPGINEQRIPQIKEELKSMAMDIGYKATMFNTWGESIKS